MALQRTRRPRFRSGRSLCSLGSPLNARPLGARKCRVLFFTLSVLLSATANRASADAPLPPPAKYRVCSSSESFCAVADPVSQSVSIYRHGESTPVWSLRAWHRQVFIANDGDHLVIGPSGLNMIPVATRLRDPLFVFMDRKATVRVVSVGDLFPSLSSLRRTVSHYDWGHIVGISAHDQLVVDLVDGRRVAFSVVTGLEEAEK
jgi:hypothetical protein